MEEIRMFKNNASFYQATQNFDRGIKAVEEA